MDKPLCPNCLRKSGVIKTIELKSKSYIHTHKCTYCGKILESWTVPIKDILRATKG